MKQNAKNDIVCDVLNRTIFKERARRKKKQQIVRANTHKDRTKEFISLSFLNT
jgi:hypothetical protein